MGDPICTFFQCVCFNNSCIKYWNRRLWPAMIAPMNLNFRQSIRKHNGFMAMLLSMVIVISGSLQLAHDQLLDHHHDSDCAMYFVDGNAPVSNETSGCSTIKQQVENQIYSPLTVVISQFNHHAPRAPPVVL